MLSTCCVWMGRCCFGVRVPALPCQALDTHIVQALTNENPESSITFVGRRFRQGSPCSARKRRETNDPLMPLLFSLGMKRALVTVKSKLKEGQKFFAFLDGVYVIWTPKRVLDVFQLLQTELHNRVSISIKTTPKFGIGEDMSQWEPPSTAAARREYQRPLSGAGPIPASYRARSDGGGSASWST